MGSLIGALYWDQICFEETGENIFRYKVSDRIVTTTRDLLSELKPEYLSLSKPLFLMVHIQISNDFSTHHLV